MCRMLRRLILFFHFVHECQKKKKGVRGAYSLLHQEGGSHDAFPIQMLTICLGIVAGLFAAAMIVYPSGKRRSLYVSL
jgi:hypothetical protein